MSTTNGELTDAAAELVEFDRALEVGLAQTTAARADG